MPRSEQGQASTVLSPLGARRSWSRAAWLLLLLGSALALAPQLGCSSPQTADGAGGQSGDEGRHRPPPPSPERYQAR